MDRIDLFYAIKKLKAERNAVILAHNYQVKEIQEVADFVGDSLGLSIEASRTDADVILFCGVHFMGETAKIVNPNKRVIIPDLQAGCSLADSCPFHELENFLKKNIHKNYYIIAYINCTAPVKALSDIICTSGNAIQVVQQAPLDRPILFLPDENLGMWVMEKTGRFMELWKGSCYVHLEYTRNSISRVKEKYPKALVIAHPECTPAVRLLADEVCSTEKMIHFCKNSDQKIFIIVTESGMLHRLNRELPNKIFIPAPTEKCSCSECVYMKKNTLEKVYFSLRDLQPAIELDEIVRIKAFQAIHRMLLLQSVK